MEEAFGACLGAILAHVNPDTASADWPALAATANASGLAGWEPLGPFKDPGPGACLQQGEAPTAGSEQPTKLDAATSEARNEADCGATAPSKPAPLPTAGDADDTHMAALFRRARRRLERLRRYNNAARFREARDQAAAVLGATAGGGCRGL